MRSFLVVASALAVSAGAAAIVACGSDASGTAASAESKADASGTSTPAEWIPGNHGGYVFLRYGNGALSVVASFFQIPGGRVCSTTTSGPCVLTDCTASAADAGASDGLSDPAGSIRITGGALPAGYGTNYQDDGTYVYKETPVTGVPWNVGDPITFTASGEWVPTFTATVPAPATSATVVTVDAGADAGATPVDRTQPYVVSWTGATGGKVDLVMNSGGTTLHSVSAACTFDAAAGTGAVPAAVLAKMVAGPAETLLCPASDTTVTAGQYTVSVSVQSGATGGTSSLVFP